MPLEVTVLVKAIIPNNRVLEPLDRQNPVRLILEGTPAIIVSTLVAPDLPWCHDRHGVSYPVSSAQP